MGNSMHDTEYWRWSKMLHEILAFRKLTGGKQWIVGISPPFRVWVAGHVFDTSRSDGV